MKVVELYIQEDDESGVSELSLVSQPATHYDWLVFNNEGKCEGSCELKKQIKTGESFSHLIKSGIPFRVDDITEQEFHKFYSPFSTANRESNEDNDRELVRYFYAVDIGMGATLIRESRAFCRDFIFAGLIYRDEDLTDMSRQMSTLSDSRQQVPRTPGYDVSLKEWKMGKQCRHIFRRLTFNVPEGMTKEEFASTLPTNVSQGVSMADTNQPQQGNGGISNRAGYLAGRAGFSEEVENPIGYAEGLIVYPSMSSMVHFEKVLYGWSLIEFEGVQGYVGGIADDDYFETEGVKVLDSGYIQGDFTSEEETFETYNDYPKAASEAACRAVKYAEENGWGSCGEATGKRRASQLCNRENISEETIARMASFKRHQQHKDVPYDEGCGGLMWDAWGSDEGIDWASRKLEQIRKERMTTYTGCIGRLIVDGVGELEAIKQCSKDRNAHHRAPYYDPTDNKEYDIDTDYVEDREMIDGIVELLIEIDDMEERKKVAYEAIETLTGEGVSFDLKDFISRLGLEGQMMFNKQSFKDELKYELTTVVMEPNRYIPRRDENNGDEIYYVVFSPETIKLMAQKFFKNDRHKSFNVEHSDLTLDGGYVYESWLVGSDPKKDKAYDMGFNVNPGTWMVSMKWDNKKEFEEYVLSKQTLGISLEGNFLSREYNQQTENYSVIGEMGGEPIFSTEEEALDRALELGCSGFHKHQDGYMACQSHQILEGVKNSLYKDEYDVFIDEVRNIINNK